MTRRDRAELLLLGLFLAGMASALAVLFIVTVPPL